MDSVFKATNGTGRVMCDIIINGQNLENVGIRYKGFSSVDVKDLKNPFNIDLAYTRKNKNYEGYTSLRLSNVNYDPSFIREALSYEIARKYMPAPLANFARVYVNDTLLGLYSNVEAVNSKFITKYFPTNNNTFIKGSPAALEYPFGQNANLAKTHGTDSLNYMPFYEIESEYGWSDLYHFIRVLNDQPDSVGQVLNIDRTLWMHAFNYSLLNFDSYIGYSQNYYLYKDDNGRFNTIPWDMNMSFGSFRESDGSYHFNGLTIKEIAHANPLNHLDFTISPRPLTKNLFQNDTYRKMFLAHIRTIVKENFTNNLYYQRASAIHGLIAPAVLQDINKFYSYAAFLQNLDSNVGDPGSKDEFPGIKSLIESRMAYLDTFPGMRGAPSVFDVSHYPTNPEQGQTVWITAHVNRGNHVILGYRYESSDIFQKINMVDDGIHHDSLAGDGLFGVAVSVKSSTLQYFIYAENDSAAIFSPERAEYEFYNIQPLLKRGDIAINELMPEYVTLSDPIWFHSPWLELVNNTSNDIQLEGLSLATNLSHEGWVFPDTMIKRRSYIVIWTSMEQRKGILADNFEIHSTGGSLYLLNQAGIVIDSVQYTPSPEGKSIGRYPNGLGAFTFMEPTISAANLFGTTPLSGFNLYPNPASRSISVELTNHNNPLKIEILNICGKLMLEENYSASAYVIPVTTKKINVSGLEQGLFYIRVTSNDEVTTKPLIIH